MINGHGPLPICFFSVLLVLFLLPSSFFPSLLSCLSSTKQKSKSHSKLLLLFSNNSKCNSSSATITVMLLYCSFQRLTMLGRKKLVVPVENGECSSCRTRDFLQGLDLCLSWLCMLRISTLNEVNE